MRLLSRGHEDRLGSNRNEEEIRITFQKAVQNGKGRKERKKCTVGPFLCLSLSASL